MMDDPEPLALPTMTNPASYWAGVLFGLGLLVFVIEMVIAHRNSLRALGKAAKEGGPRALATELSRQNREGGFSGYLRLRWTSSIFLLSMATIALQVLRLFPHRFSLNQFAMGAIIIPGYTVMTGFLLAACMIVWFVSSWVKALITANVLRRF